MPNPGEMIYWWSTTALDNGTVDPGIDWAEGMPRAQVNNSARSTMAALAHARDWSNGSITTTGTPAAQAFASGYGSAFTTVPPGFVVRLKIGAGLTSTGAMTLNMDGIGAASVRDNRSREIGAGSIAAGSYYEFLFDGTYWRLLATEGGIAAPQCGRLTCVSATQLRFAPMNGDRLKVNGTIYLLPSAGIAGLANTGVHVNNLPGNNLTPATTYLVFAKDDGAGGLVANFHDASAVSHLTSSTIGNVGVEVMGSPGATDAFTLLGMIRTNASAQFSDTASQRYVRSWLNEPAVSIRGPSLAGAAITHTAGFALVGGTVEFLAWEDESLSVFFNGFADNDTVGAAIYSTILFDAAAPVPATDGGGYATGVGTSLWQALAAARFDSFIPEGRHTVAIGGFVTAGTAHYYGAPQGTLSGP